MWEDGGGDPASYPMLEEKLPVVEKVMSDVNQWLQSKKALEDPSSDFGISLGLLIHSTG